MSGKKGAKWVRDKDGVPNTPKYKKAKEDIAVMLRKGYLINEIYAEILLDIEDLPDLSFQRMVRAAYDDIKVTIHRNREYIFKLHMDRYEDTFRKAIDMIGRDQRPLTPKTDWHEMVGRYIVALKALKHKEDLLGLHNKEVVVEINESEATIKMAEKSTGKTSFQVDRLSSEEALELLKLLKQAKLNEDEGVRRLVIKKSPLQLLSDNPKLEDDIVDTIYEEMPEKVVDKIQTVIETIPPNEADANVVDARSPETIKRGRTLEQVQSDMKSNVLEKFKQMLKDKKQK